MLLNLLRQLICMLGYYLLTEIFLFKLMIKENYSIQWILNSVKYIKFYNIRYKNCLFKHSVKMMSIAVTTDSVKLHIKLCDS